VKERGRNADGKGNITSEAQCNKRAGPNGSGEKKQPKIIEHRVAGKQGHHAATKRSDSTLRLPYEGAYKGVHCCYFGGGMRASGYKRRGPGQFKQGQRPQKDEGGVWGGLSTGE